MTTTDFLALPAYEQNAMVAPLVGWHQHEDGWWRPWHGEMAPHPTGVELLDVGPDGAIAAWLFTPNVLPYATGDDWALFGEAWDALPREDGRTWNFCERQTGEIEVWDLFLPPRKDSVYLFGPTRNLAVALALLVAAGKVEQ